jgi:hypothetical protein
MIEAMHTHVNTCEGVIAGSLLAVLPGREMVQVRPKESFSSVVILHLVLENEVYTRLQISTRQ